MSKLGGEHEWIKAVMEQDCAIVQALEGVADPTGDYMLSLGRRVDKLEHDVEHLETQLHPSPGIATR